MPRCARVVIPGKAHHVTQRGNNQQNVFYNEQDCATYCYWLNKYSNKYGVDVLAYCLMSNHVHLILTPADCQGMALMLKTVHMRFAQYKHHKRKTSGHLWQGRYFSCVLDEDHLFYAMRYVEQNPVRAGMVVLPWEYKWSSARWHLGMSVETFIKVKKTTAVDKKYWKDYLMSGDTEMDNQLRRKTYKGKAFAGKEFVDHWESKLKCVLRESRPGRKMKK